MAASQTVIDNARILIEAAARLNVPLLVSGAVSPGPWTYSARDCRARSGRPDGGENALLMHRRSVGFAERFRAIGRRQAIVAGIEAHVCVLQTVEDLLTSGTETFVVADATSSRTERNHMAAIERLRCAGARIVTTEMVVFEWLAKAGTPEFKDLSALIK